jgi:putative spermidine/putrescine transport system permease protein
MSMSGDAQHRAYFGLLAPACVAMILFFFAPLLQVLWISISEPAYGLQNYRALIDNPLIHRIWWNTLFICSVTTAIAVCIGYVVAYAMTQVGERHRTAMILIITLTFWLSVLVRSFAWVMLLRTEGVVNTGLQALGVIDQPLRLVRNELGVIIGMVHYMVPVAVLPIYSSMRTIPAQFSLAARGLGASPGQAFRLVYLPMTKPGVIAAAILVFIFSLGFYITPAILGGGRVLMIAEYIRVSFVDTLRWGYATMLASTLLLFITVALLALARIVDVRKVFGT